MIQSTPLRGLLFVMVGPGGAGKNAIMRKILENNETLAQLATATTRPARDTEKHGREHLFVTHEEFNRLIQDDELLEWQEVTADKFYGIPRDVVESKLSQGQDLIADIEVNGAKILRSTYPDNATLVFVTVPGETLEDKLSVLRERLSNGERQETPDMIEERLERARILEFPFADDADYLVVNDIFDKAVEEVQNIISQHQERRLQSQEMSS